MADSTKGEENIGYSRFICIGSGFSGIALGASLKRWYGITDIQLFERGGDIGGTWYWNKYPGCACDVPTSLYSLSFAPNSSWSRILPGAEELHVYLKKVAVEYGLVEKTKFGCTVKRCEWMESKKRWRVTVHDAATDTTFQHDCQFLYSGTGILVEPRYIDVPGSETFKGDLIHASRWPSDLSLKDKDVIIVGNGCTADQIVPAIIPDVKSVTQIARSKHYIRPALPDLAAIRNATKYVPGLMYLMRFAVFALGEADWQGFYMTKYGAFFRNKSEPAAIAYMKKTAPKKYHDLLIPDFPIGCKRRIYDPGYLPSLHSEKVTLTMDKILAIVPEGLRTESGIVKADVIALATGFKTNNFMGDIELVGQNGKTLQDHWKHTGPGAYNSIMMNGFPNFFFLLGPNTATGHTSTILAIENAVNYTLRIIQPALTGHALTVQVKAGAEKLDVADIQKGLQKTVWHDSCDSWYVRGKDGKPTRNASTYPYSQFWYWYRCFWPTYSDLIYGAAPNPPPKNRKLQAMKLLLWAGLLFLSGKTFTLLRENDWNVKIALMILGLKLQMQIKGLQRRFA